MHAYGWTLEYTVSKPRHILSLLYYAIVRRKHDDYCRIANLHGVKIDQFDTIAKNSTPPAEIKPEQEKIIINEIDRIFREKAGD
jgi:hypothetical protein